MKTKTGYVVAIRQKEADEIARDMPELVHSSMQSAAVHLAEVKAPPTDPFYANQYRIYPVSAQSPQPTEERKR